MNKRYCCITENLTAAKITAGYQYEWQEAHRPVATLDADYRLCRGCCADAAVWVTAARLSVTLVCYNVLNCC